MLLDLIRKRQSVRNYLPKAIPRDEIEICLEAARLAPSACNSQPWRFIVIDDPKIKNKLCDSIFNGPYSINSFARSAPVFIVVVSEKASFLTRMGGNIRGTAYYLMDVAIATQHFVLQAAELGIGTCWIGWFNESETKKIIGIPKDKKLDCIIAMGYSQDRLRIKNRKSLGEISSYNKY